MASRQNTDSGESGREQQGQGASAGASGAGASGADQERPVEVSREGSPQGMQPGESAGARASQPGGQQGVQRGSQRGGTSGGRQSASLLPAFMANPGLMASAFMANPFEFAELMSSEMDRIFDTFGSGAGSAQLSSGAGASRQLGGAQRGGTQRGTALSTGQQGQRSRGGLSSFTPQIEMLQRGNELVLRADLPGLRPEDVNVEIEDGVLAISGERREEAEDQRDGFYHSERRYGSFYRAVPLPEGVSEEQIQASVRDGVLEVTVPLPQQQESPRARRIPVQGASGAAGSGTSTPGGDAGASGATGGSSTSGNPSYTEG